MKPLINLVLVSPSYSGNVGSCVRALANMGGHQLIMISPQCTVDDLAKQNACGARDWLQRIKIYNSWDDFNSVEPLGARIALSRRVGKRRVAKDLRQTILEFTQQAPEDVKAAPFYIVLGPEADGLSQFDVEQCHRTATLPTHGSFKSINLSHAAFLALYIAQETLQPLTEKRQTVESSDTLVEQNNLPEQTIKDWIEALGFDVNKRKRSALVVLRRLLLQNWPSPYELHVLESILQQNIRKLNDRSLLLEKVSD